MLAGLRSRKNCRMKCVTLFAFFVLLIGSVNAALRPRIIGGEDADIRNFPYLASIRVRSKHYCMGCIVSDRHILTAAHCITYNKNIVPPYDNVVVSTGCNKTTEIGHSHRIARIEVHPGWIDSVDASFFNDIAVITIADKIHFDERQQKIKLATENAVTGTDAVLAGWGRRSKTENAKMSVDLQQLRMTILDHTDCQSHYMQQAINKEQLCAYHKKGHGPCYGDSGSALISDLNELVGLVSWVYEGDCANGMPEVYTNIYAYRRFINEQIIR